MVVSEELHCTVLVRFCVVPSLNIPVAVKDSAAPTWTRGKEGATTIAVSAAGITVRTVEFETNPDVAVIPVVPWATLVTSPWDPALLLTVATFCAVELQVTEVVRSSVLPSVYVPTALNCCVVPKAIDGLGGVTASETRAGGLTVSVADPDTVPEAALIVAAPVATLLARPVLVMVAMAVLEELHVTELVRIC